MEADSSIFRDREKARSFYRLRLSLFLISLFDFALFDHLLFIAHIGLCVLLTSLQAMVGSNLEVLFLLLVCELLVAMPFDVLMSGRTVIVTRDTP